MTGGGPTRGGDPHHKRSYDVAFYLPTLGPLLSAADGVPAGGGAETQIWLLARGLARQGCAVCVVVTDPPGGVARTVDRVDVLVRQPRQRTGAIRRKTAELAALWSTLAPLDADVIVQRTAGISTGLVGAITRIKRRSFVYSSANIVDFDFERLASTRAELRLFTLGIRLAKTIVVQTQEQAVRCFEKFGRKATVIRSIAEPAGPRAGSPDAFLWVGRLVSYKHPEAYLELAHALPEARFRMVGLPSDDEPELGRRVEREARKLGNLELLAPRSRPELLRLYDTTAAVVNTADFEGMPNIFLEGWSRGIPALALTHDPDNVIRSHGLGGFADGSPARLAALARDLWSSKDSQAELAAPCLDYVRREHAPEAVIGAWLDALRRPSRHAPCAPRPSSGGARTDGRLR